MTSAPNTTALYRAGHRWYDGGYDNTAGDLRNGITADICTMLVVSVPR
jgi:hypothetical protein